MISIESSTLFYKLLFYEPLQDITVKELGFFINGYSLKDSIENNTEPWIDDFIDYINLEVCRLFLNSDRSPQAYYGIINDHQETNQDGLKLFYKILYDYCEIHIVDFNSNLDLFKSKAITRIG